MTDKVSCRLCGIPCDDEVAEAYHWFKDHWNWYAGLERIRQLSKFTIPQLEARQRQLDAYKKKEKKK